MSRIDTPHRVWLLFAALAAAAAMALVPASANASPKPSCVTVSHSSGWVTQTTTVTNRCGYTVSFVVHRVGPDSPCLHASPNTSRSYKWSNGLNYEGTTFGCD